MLKNCTVSKIVVEPLLDIACSDVAEFLLATQWYYDHRIGTSVLLTVMVNGQWLE